MFAVLQRLLNIVQMDSQGVWVGSEFLIPNLLAVFCPNYAFPTELYS